MYGARLLLPFVTLSALLAADVATRAAAPEGWTAEALRDEIRPGFAWDSKGGRNGSGALIIETDARDGLDGFWKRTVPVEGGRYYRFQAYRRVIGVEWPQQCAVVTVQWYDAAGKRVIDDRRLVGRYLTKYQPLTPLEYPVESVPGSDGWTKLAGTWQAPSAAKQAVIELHGRWAPNGRMEWSDVQLTETDAPAPRIVRLASIHYRPRAGKTAEEKRRQFAPFIAEAARRKADLVVLPETLTYYNTGLSPAEAAEPIPGPSTRYFAELAKEHNVYIVAGLFEKDAHKVYNVAVLLSPEGRLAGKYRKVTLPDGEASAGVVPGREYPIFNTRFGTLGMMICYDGFFPEVARELAKRGAEVIAWPVWGCNPELARARAAENHVYLVSSTYEDISSNWMLSAVWDRTGDTLSVAKDWGSIAIAEVDLNAATRWRSLGDFRSKIQHHVPMTVPARRWEDPLLGR
ncbi:MAG TPA: carbon-nitrogen hydrolase family protein [Bryobacteraceae bacterium]|nr:carbon-nitrogen hydrolase family protein [Bryobacteraceae bacterium]